MGSFLNVVVRVLLTGKTQMPSEQSAPLRHAAVGSHGVQLPPHLLSVCHPPIAAVQEEYSVHSLSLQMFEKQSVPTVHSLPEWHPNGSPIEFLTKPFVHADNDE